VFQKSGDFLWDRLFDIKIIPLKTTIIISWKLLGHLHCPPIIPPLHWFQVTSSVRSRYPLPCNPDWISKLFSGRRLQPKAREREREISNPEKGHPRKIPPT